MSIHPVLQKILEAIHLSEEKIKHAKKAQIMYNSSIVHQKSFKKVTP